MSLWRQLRRGLSVLTHRAAAEREVADELEHYLEQAAGAHRARGLAPAEALRAARLELGSVTGVRDEVRAAGWESAVESLLADLRYGVRRLRAEPVFATMTVLTLAVGIGATTAIFSAVDPILFQPLPYPRAERIVTLWESGSDGARYSDTFGAYSAVVERSRSFDALAAVRSWRPALVGRGEPERLEGRRVNAGWFRVLGVEPALGRGLRAEEDHPGGAREVVLGDALWRRRFGADPGVLGRAVSLDDDLYTVVGVMPPGFEDVLAPSAEVWKALQYDLSDPRAWGHHLQIVGRLRPGVSRERAARELGPIAADLRRQHPDEFPQRQFLVASLQDDVTAGVRPALYVILAAVALVLVVAGVNVTNLLLARGVRRRGELALRAALGAVRGRLVRQLVTESLLLASVGGAAGLGVAILGVRALVALAPPGLPRVAAIGIDGEAFAFALAASALLGLACGTLPALRAGRTDPQQALGLDTRRSTGGHRRTRSALVVAEVAIALALLVGSGLLQRSLQRLFAVESGFDSSRLLTLQVQTTGQRFADGAVADRFFAEVLEAVRRVPGVTSAGLTSQLPLSGDQDEYGVHFEAGTTRPAESHGAYRYAVSPGYVETMGIRLRRGRLLGADDRAGAPLVALVSESLAATRFGAADPLGHRLRIGPTDGPPLTIVGVVRDVKQLSLAASEANAVYVTESQAAGAGNADVAMSLVVRGHDDLVALVPALRRAVWSVDKDQPIVRVATMEELVATLAAERRFALVLCQAFTLAALVLAALGIYGVLAGSVAERRREIGVRAALGASRQRIVALVVRQGMALTGIGVAIGLVAAMLLSRVMVAMLFGISRLDPVSYLGAVLVLASAATVACSVPAWRAARTDPASTLAGE